MPKEFITHEAGSYDAWICICGNTPDSDGFYTCDEAGDEIEPTADSDWNGLYVCANCGRIIDQETLEIVGQNPHPKLLA
jgi:hypothetical protein